MSEATAAFGAPHDASHDGARRFVPGETGIWVFIFADLFTFAIYFAGFFGERARIPMEFASSSASLSMTVALINTLVLLTSSLLVVIAVNAMRTEGAAATARLALKLAMLCGLIFVALKLYEYNHMIGLGQTMTSNSYFGYFFVLTGMHFCHVIAGLVILYLMSRKASSGRMLNAREFRLFEAGACYWHLVDLLWMVIFPLLFMVS